MSDRLVQKINELNEMVGKWQRWWIEQEEESQRYRGMLNEILNYKGKVEPELYEILKKN